MATIKENQDIQGSQSVSRNLYVGNNATINGDSIIGRNLRVDGWLEAKNIKDVNKGLFTSKVALDEAYPNPESGWLALVGNTIPAAVYVAKEGKWEATGQKSGELTVEFTSYTDRLNTIEDRIVEAETDIQQERNDRNSNISDLLTKVNLEIQHRVQGDSLISDSIKTIEANIEGLNEVLDNKADSEDTFRRLTTLQNEVENIGKDIQNLDRHSVIQDIYDRLLEDAKFTFDARYNMFLDLEFSGNSKFHIPLPTATETKDGILSFTDKQKIEKIKDCVKYGVFTDVIDKLPDNIIEYADKADIENKPIVICYCKADKSFILMRNDTKTYYQRWWGCEEFGTVINAKVVPTYYKVYFSSLLDTFAIGCDSHGLNFLARQADFQDLQESQDALMQDFINLQNHEVIINLSNEIEHVNETAGDAYTSLSQTVRSQENNLQLLCDADQLVVTGRRGIVACDADRKTDNIIYRDLTLNLAVDEAKMCPIAIDATGEIVASTVFRNMVEFATDILNYFGRGVRPITPSERETLLNLIKI